MKLIFCGGANEVGALCYLIKIYGKNILLDCGIRMSSSKDNLLDFQLNKRRMFLYHAVLESELSKTKDDGAMEVNQMLSLIDEYFSSESRLIKKARDLM
ncbi:hypothetical protein [Thermoanaerobacterium sp. RBIITD]|uniref:hypothetical protein n=1 Tax=Thermoanaerobacterium sp. RBIITD TaxID=1550240 RepID=UPI000BB78546|nr:hypothetical protein [Thermoanaerobacterium sp. RBIITD]